ncbi:MAG: hypothetical protein DI570_29915 [Phenylobacterium zucineum]|nr:MAG: hypothetical protein DI570_29915 [Phenylobacterium zucineum]
MDRIGLEVILAAVVAAWFVVTGIVELFSRSAPAGRRAVAADPGWLILLRRVRGALAVLGGLVVAAGAALDLLGRTNPLPGRDLGFALAAIAVWAVGEAVHPPARWVRVALGVVGFLLAVSYAGFRA